MAGFDLMTLEEVRRETRFSSFKLRTDRLAGLLKAYRFGRSIRVRRKDFDAYVRRAAVIHSRDERKGVVDIRVSPSRLSADSVDSERSTRGAEGRMT